MMKPKPLIDEDGEVRELDAGFFKQARRGRPELPSEDRKKRVQLTLDQDVVRALKATGNMSGAANDFLRDKLGL